MGKLSFLFFYTKFDKLQQSKMIYLSRRNYRKGDFMYTLTEDERKLFAEMYFDSWGDDIMKVTLMEYDDVNEYLINDHYVFLMNK